MLERDFSVTDLAVKWDLSDDTIRRWFRDEPGVQNWGRRKPGKRAYDILRIPQSVAERVYRRVTKQAA